jgi:hypothetical protein
VSALILSASGGIVHTYYTALLAPSLCALVCAGGVSLWGDLRRGESWPLLPLGAIGLTAAVQLNILGRTDYLPWLAVAVVLLCLAAAGVVALGLRRPAARGGTRLASAGLCVGLAALLLAPAAWAATTGRGAVSGVFPGAGPGFVSGLTQAAGGFGGGGGGPGIGGGGNGTTTDAESALAYAEANGPGTRWSLIVTSEEEAAPLVIAGARVAAMGGFTGRETVLSPALLSQIVASGQARNFLLGATRSLTRTVNPSVALVEAACAPVGAAGGGATLYDCAGAAAALAAGG